MQVGGHESGRQAVKLRAKVAQGDGFVALRLDGVIDEHNGLAQMADALTKGDLLAIDLGGVKRLNSVGVRDWVNFLRAVRARFKTIVLFDCPAPVMNEVNFVKNFAEGAYITSFVAPLFCAQCGKEEPRLLETHRLRNGAGIALPPFQCERTDCQNALDDDEETYLGFVKTLPENHDPERLARLTDQARAALATSGTALTAAPRPLDPHDNATAGRAPLGQVGLGGVPRKSQEAMPNPLAKGAGDGVATADKSEELGGDWLFIAAMGAMMAVLGVLIYLILTLE